LKFVERDSVSAVVLKGMRFGYDSVKSLAMKQKTFLIFLFLSYSLNAQDCSTIDKEVVSRIKSDIKILASDLMEGREPGTAGEIKARDFIVERMQDIGLQPRGVEGYIQAFPFSEEDSKKAHNIIGFLDNGAQQTVVITAHYDHLGYGSYPVNHISSNEIHNGADDNASGTAALLELAYYLKSNPIKEKNNFLFIAFSAEEKGLKGSKYFVLNPSLNLSAVNYVLNMDMIGRMETGMPLTIEGLGSSLIWESSLKAIECDAFPLTLKKRENGPSDHAPFYYAGIPALHFWTGKHDDYHKPSDDVEKINFEAESQIISFIESFILLMDTKGKIDFYLREK